ELPKIEYGHQQFFETLGDLIGWLKRIYRDQEAEIISYEEIIPIPSFNQTSTKFSKRLIPGVGFVQKEISMKKWVNNVASINLVTWIKKFNLNHGVVINSNTLTPSKNAAINFEHVPELIVKNDLLIEEVQSTTYNEFLLNNNMSIETFKYLRTFGNFQDCLEDKLISKEFTYYIIRIKKIELDLSINFIKPVDDFKIGINNAFREMRPYQALQEVFKKYGYFWPQKITLGGFLRAICPQTSNSKPPDSDTYHNLKAEEIGQLILNNKNITNDLVFLTSDGNVIRKEKLNDWIESIENYHNLTVIDFDKFTPLYEIFKNEQCQIEMILNNNSLPKILLTGITDISVKDCEHIRIDFNEDFNSTEFVVFGSVVDKNNLPIKDCSLNFGLYDYSGFSAIVINTNPIKKESDMRIMWAIVGEYSLGIRCPDLRDESSIQLIKDLKINCKDFSEVYPIENSILLSEEWSSDYLHLTYSKKPESETILNICVILPENERENKNFNIDKFISYNSIGYKLDKTNCKQSYQDDRIFIDSVKSSTKKALIISTAKEQLNTI
ncbi:2186_t:CDS:2, partial [Cetraspora pellucida]